MKRYIKTTCALCFMCVVAYGEGGFLGKIKKTVDAVAEISTSANHPATQPLQPENKKTLENAEGLKYRKEANDMLNKIKAEQRDASPSELYIIGRGFSYKPDGSPDVSYSDMNQSVIPRYYEKAARGGNADALLFLLKFYGLGYIEDYGGIGAPGATTDEQRFREICELKVEKFADYKVPAELSRLASLVDTTCTEIVNIRAQEAAEKEARLTAVKKQKEEQKRREAQELARRKTEEEARLAEKEKQKEEEKRQQDLRTAQKKAREEVRQAEEAKQKEEEKRQEDQLIAQKKARDEILTDTKIKFPKADLFKSHVKVYKDFESGVSFQWAVAKLEKDGISFKKDTPSVFYGTSLIFKDGNNEVSLAFASETDDKENPEAILAMALIVLPSDISHETALKKYRDQYPNAKIKRETEKKAVDNDPKMLDNDMILIPEYAWLITKDHITT